MAVNELIPHEGATLLAIFVVLINNNFLSINNITYVIFVLKKYTAFSAEVIKRKQFLVLKLESTRIFLGTDDVFSNFFWCPSILYCVPVYKVSLYKISG